MEFFAELFSEGKKIVYEIFFVKVQQFAIFVANILNKTVIAGMQPHMKPKLASQSLYGWNKRMMLEAVVTERDLKEPHPNKYGVVK